MEVLCDRCKKPFDLHETVVIAYNPSGDDDRYELCKQCGKSFHDWRKGMAIDSAERIPWTIL